MSARFRYKEIRYSRYSEIMKKHSHENYSSLFKEHLLTNLLRFERNKRKRSQNMLLREQTHIYRRFKLLV